MPGRNAIIAAVSGKVFQRGDSFYFRIPIRHPDGRYGTLWRGGFVSAGEADAAKKRAERIRDTGHDLDAFTRDYNRGDPIPTLVTHYKLVTANDVNLLREHLGLPKRFGNQAAARKVVQPALPPVFDEEAFIDRIAARVVQAIREDELFERFALLATTTAFSSRPVDISLSGIDLDGPPEDRAASFEADE